MNYSDVKPIPKSACYSLTQIIGASVILSNGTDMPLTTEEATHTLIRAYPMRDKQQEMLYDGNWGGLAEPFSCKYAQKTGVDLENRMIESVDSLYDLRWWDQSKKRADRELDRIVEATQILVTKECAQSIWERFWAYLGRDSVPRIKRFVPKLTNPFEGAVYDCDVADEEALKVELGSAKARIADLENKLVEVTAASKQQADVATEQPPLMKIATEIYRQFWSTFDKDAPGAKAPTQTEIVAWVKEKYDLAENTAKAVEKVACPFDRNPSKK
jgi:hypothetical protein